MLCFTVLICMLCSELHYIDLLEKIDSMDYGRLLESKGHWFRSNLEFHKAFRPNHVVRIVVTCEIKINNWTKVVIKKW